MLERLIAADLSPKSRSRIEILDGDVQHASNAACRLGRSKQERGVPNGFERDACLFAGDE